MKRIKISHELIARFVEGNTSAQETELILQVAEKSRELREHLDFLFSMSKDSENMNSHTNESETAKVVSLGFVPMWRLAAQNKFFNHTRCHL